MQPAWFLAGQVLKFVAFFTLLHDFMAAVTLLPDQTCIYIENLTRVIISYGIYETSLRRVSFQILNLLLSLHSTRFYGRRDITSGSTLYIHRGFYTSGHFIWNL